MSGEYRQKERVKSRLQRKVWREIGLVMNLRELGVTEEMIEGIAEGTFVMDGGYKILSHEEIVDILRKSME